MCADCDRAAGFVPESVSCCGGSWTGTPVRECRRGGIVEREWDVGVRMRTRRGLAMFLAGGSCGGFDGAVVIVMGSGIVGDAGL